MNLATRGKNCYVTRIYQYCVLPVRGGSGLLCDQAAYNSVKKKKKIRGIS